MLLHSDMGVEVIESPVSFATAGPDADVIAGDFLLQVNVNNNLAWSKDLTYKFTPGPLPYSVTRKRDERVARVRATANRVFAGPPTIRVPFNACIEWLASQVTDTHLLERWNVARDANNTHLRRWKRRGDGNRIAPVRKPAYHHSSRLRIGRSPALQFSPNVCVLRTPVLFASPLASRYHRRSWTR